MRLIINLFALVGLAAVIVAVVGTNRVNQELEQFDPKALDTYMAMGEKIIETRNAAEATIWKVPVAEGMSADEVEETMKFVANEHNISNVGELPLYKDVEAKSGKPYRYAKIFMFCNSLTAAMMLDYSDAFSAYLPCRITMIEDKQGKLWLYALDMDLMIHGGEPLPAELKAEAIKVKEIILDIMKRGAEGDF
ncbi:hypothetical protein BOW53_12170 [Solemya pervernicosa gill symbiont]|uniref:DUF302 domain-containing protein n=2 Tax=Gammaproteobacteria incertae sedis TaxID=118884 RepID=A0A1T2L2J2_9GAMM|nr:DUF302 domain-containing protein [Candidatus Reidiella endopervernicosa]OOZ39309.1 hypothetical protein BOW53_12170 [Solemya pervernicosa gill symbiont]QKQ25509.1 DUF302 domain-containing protein [Candidatus Reidiella endopervernicosa]